MFVAGKCCSISHLELLFFFLKKRCICRHACTYTQHVDIARTIAIVLAFEQETGTASQLARSFLKNVLMESAAVSPKPFFTGLGIRVDPTVPSHI